MPRINLICFPPMFLFSGETYAYSPLQICIKFPSFSHADLLTSTLLISFGFLFYLYNRCMSDSRRGEEEEAWSREEDELIPRCHRNMHDAGEFEDGGGQIIRGQQQQKPGVFEDRRKEKNKKEKDKKGCLQGNRREMQAKVKHVLHSPVRRIDKQLEGLKNMTTQTTSRRSAAPFPYDGEDFGGSPPYLCFLNPLIPSSSPSPVIHNGTSASAEMPGATIDVKPKNSSYYYFLKSLIEKNDFYSPECNVHRDVRSSQPK